MPGRLLLLLLSMSPLPAQTPATAAAEPVPATAVIEAVAGPTDPGDQFDWLEQVDSDAAMAWVRARNARSEQALAAVPGFERLQQRLLSIYTADDRLASVALHGDWLYNFWADATHPRGLWRRCSWDAWFAAGADQRKVEWEVLLDLDALSSVEGESFVWEGADFLEPECTRAMVALSRGGADAIEQREFDLTSLDWVPPAQAFFLPECKGGSSWVDHDTLLVSATLGEEAATSSGYPRAVRRWSRGQPYEEAPVVFEVESDDMMAGAWHSRRPGYERTFFSRTIDFQSSELFLERPEGPRVKIEVPDTADKFVWKDWLLVNPRFDWELDGVSHPAGSLLAAPLEAWLAGDRRLQALFTPAPNQAIEGIEDTAHHLVLTLLEDVASRLVVLTPPATVGPAPWTQAEQPGLPEFGAIAIRAVEGWNRDDLWFGVADFLTPTTQLHGRIGESPTPLRSLPAYFEAEGLAARQFFATSADGTRIPYFVVGPEQLPTDGSAPTLLYGYGGFEVSLTPDYRAGMGAAWLERGGVYVLANIRGGGEYGRRWHQAALKGGRHKTYEDFAAVARDLVARGITTPARLGAQGGSNGGLLMGNMYAQYPELFGAILCEAPLLDMLRYTQLPPGSSWIAEYGDPAVPAEVGFLRRYSPFHNLSAQRRYPPILITTSTRDDRVHPGHARKFAARIEQLGNPVLYFENIEGGHAGASTPVQAAQLDALGYEFLWDRLSQPAPLPQ